MGQLLAEVSLNRTIFMIGTVPLVDEWADGDAVTITYNSDVYTNKVGAGGAYAPARSNDDGGEIKLRIFQGSRTARAALDLIVKQQEALGLNDVTLKTFTVKDLNTGEHYRCEQCFIKGRPTAAFSNAQGVREYTFVSPNIRKLG